jgi:hypothetical protein
LTAAHIYDKLYLQTSSYFGENKMSFTIPAITIAIPSPILILLFGGYVVLSTVLVLLILISSGIPFMGAGWQKYTIWYFIFFPGTIIIFTIYGVIIGLSKILDFLFKSKILR